MAKTLLQVAVDADGTTSRASTTGIVMRHESWLQYSGFPGRSRILSEFNFFSEKSLHCLKDFRTTVCSLGIYTPTPKRKHHKQPIDPDLPLRHSIICYLMNSLQKTNGFKDLDMHLLLSLQLPAQSHPPSKGFFLMIGVSTACQY